MTIRPVSHPDVEVAYVLEGSLDYQFDGKPPVTLKAGEALFIPAGTIHSAKNVGSGNGAEFATYIVKKGKPLIVLGKWEPCTLRSLFSRLSRQFLS